MQFSTPEICHCIWYNVLPVYGYNVLPMYGCNVLPMYGYNVLSMYGCNVLGYNVLPMYGYNVLPMYGYNVLPMYGCNVLPMYGCNVLPMYGCNVLPIYGYNVLPMNGYNVHLSVTHCCLLKVCVCVCVPSTNSVTSLVNQLYFVGIPASACACENSVLLATVLSDLQSISKQHTLNRMLLPSTQPFVVWETTCLSMYSNGG